MSEESDARRVKRLREELGFSQAQMAELLGFAPGDNGARAVRKIEAGDGHTTGSVRRLLDITASGVVDRIDRVLIPEFIIGDNIEDSVEGAASAPEIVVRLWYPRFVAGVVYADQPPMAGDGEHPSLAPKNIHPGCWLAPYYWIDYPVGFDPEAVLRRAAAGLQAYFNDLDK